MSLKPACSHSNSGVCFLVQVPSWISLLVMDYVTGASRRSTVVDRRLQCQVSANPRHCKCVSKPPWQWPLRTLSAGSIRLLAMLINGANGRAGCAVEVRGHNCPATCG